MFLASQVSVRRPWKRTTAGWGEVTAMWLVAVVRIGRPVASSVIT